MPDYDPGAWNDGAIVQYGNNCYDYARNNQSGVMNNKTQPGASRGYVLEDDPFDCADIAAAVRLEGLVSIDSKDDDCPTENCWKVALATISNPADSDYHWWRQDSDGMWSHKPGHDTVRNTDDSGNVIDNPATADRGDYDVFCGYYCVCPPAAAEEARMVSSTPAGATVNAMIFSGRADPSVAIDPAQLASVVSMASGLAPYSGDPPEGTLGFGGFLVLNSSSSDDAPLAIRALNGAVFVTQGGTQSVYQDQNGLEKFLSGLFEGSEFWTQIQKAMGGR